MSLAVQHVHIKTEDPKKTIQYYIDNFGATIKARPPGRGINLDLHGLQLNVTDINKEQKDRKSTRLNSSH